MHTQRVERERWPSYILWPSVILDDPHRSLLLPPPKQIHHLPFEDSLWILSTNQTTRTPPQRGQEKSNPISMQNFVCPFWLFLFLKKFDDESKMSAINEASKRLDGSLTDGNKPNVMQCSPARRIQVQPIGNMLKLDGIVPGY